MKCDPVWPEYVILRSLGSGRALHLSEELTEYDSRRVSDGVLCSAETWSGAWITARNVL